MSHNRFKVTVYNSWSGNPHLVAQLPNYDEVVEIVMRYIDRYSIIIYDEVHDINFEFLT